MKIKFLACTFILMLGLLTFNCHAFDGRAISKDGKLVVTYKIENGFNVYLKIDTTIKKGAYTKNLQADINSINVDFIDVNNDGMVDVIIKYADETGYSPDVFAYSMSILPPIPR